MKFNTRLCSVLSHSLKWAMVSCVLSTLASAQNAKQNVNGSPSLLSAQAVTPLAQSYVTIHENNLEITGWSGTVTLVQTTQEGIFAVENFNNGTYKFPVTNKLQSGATIPLPKDLNISHLESANIDAHAIESLNGFTPTLGSGLSGMHVALDQIIVGDFPDFNDDGSYTEETFNPATNDVDDVKIPAKDRAALMLTLATANGNLLDPRVLVLNKLSQKAAAHLGMIDCDRLPEGAYPNTPKTFPLAYRNNLAGNCRDTKGGGFFSSGKTRAHFACSRNGNKVFSQFCYDTSIAFNIPAAGSDAADKANIIVSLSRAYTDEDSITGVGQPLELIRFVIPRQALITPKNLTVVTSFTNTTSATPTVVLVFKPMVHK